MILNHAIFIPVKQEFHNMKQGTLVFIEFIQADDYETFCSIVSISFALFTIRDVMVSFFI